MPTRKQPSAAFQFSVRSLLAAMSGLEPIAWYATISFAPLALALVLLWWRVTPGHLIESTLFHACGYHPKTTPEIRQAHGVPR